LAASRNSSNLGGSAGRPSGLELLEEAIHLLRSSPMQVLACYYIGSLPFVLALLYFLADMSRSAQASWHLPGASLGLCILFVWMKCWHGVFAGRLMASFGGQEAPSWTAGSIARLVLAQGTVGPVGLAVAAMAMFPLIGLYVRSQSVPVLVSMVPLGGILLFVLSWPYAYFQGATVLLGNPAACRRGGLSLFGAPARAASYWPGQNVQALLLLSMLGLLVWMNIAQAMLLPPLLAKEFLDVETVFSRGGFDPSNTTFLAISLSLTYLLVDPVVKAFYTLRCFYGLSFHNGQDLLAELKAAVRSTKTIGVLAIVLVLALVSSRAWAGDQVRAGETAATQPAAVNSPAGGISPGKLDDSIKKVISRREYAWRMPTPPERQHERAGWLESVIGWLDSVRKAVGEALAKAWHWLGELWDKLWGKKESKPDGFTVGGSGTDWSGALTVIIYILVGLAVAAVAALLWVTIRRRRAADKPRESSPAGAAPDLGDENVGPQRLPEQGWLDLARQMLSQGDRRLALRALYLASLALLSERGMISVAKFKSNRQYQLEVQKRAPAPAVGEAFGANVTFFEDAWYGMHDVTETIVERFLANQNTLRSV
jgi:hypothetical protein